MFNTHKRLKAVLAVICFFGILTAGFAADFKASNFVLKDTAGKNVNLSDYKGKNVILFFWSTWCPYCVREMRKLKNDYKLIQSKSFELLAVNVGERVSSVSRFLKDNPVDFKILLDSDSEVSFEYNVIGLPTFYIISRDGNILFIGNKFPEDYASYTR
jgi:peroxiredoxin